SSQALSGGKLGVGAWLPTRSLVNRFAERTSTATRAALTIVDTFTSASRLPLKRSRRRGEHRISATIQHGTIVRRVGGVIPSEPVSCSALVQATARYVRR